MTTTTQTAHQKLISQFGAVASLGSSGDCWIPAANLTSGQREQLRALESYGVSPAELTWARWCDKTARTRTAPSGGHRAGEDGISVPTFFVASAAACLG